MAIVNPLFIRWGITKFLFRAYNRVKTQTWLSCHYKFISEENITIPSVSSDDFLHAILEVAEQQMWSYSSYVKKELNSQARAEGVKILGVRSIKKQEWGFSVGQPILIYALFWGLVAGGIF